MFQLPVGPSNNGQRATPNPRVTGVTNQQGLNVGAGFNVQADGSVPANFGGLSNAAGWKLMNSLLAAQHEAGEREQERVNKLAAKEEERDFGDWYRTTMDKYLKLKGRNAAMAPQQFAKEIDAEAQRRLDLVKHNPTMHQTMVDLYRPYAEQGLNTIFSHQREQIHEWDQSMLQREMVDLYNEIYSNPAGWADIEAWGLASIQAANPGLDTTAKEHAFRRQLATLGVESAIAQGQPETARAIINKLGTSKDKADLETIFAAAESKARVKAGTQAGLKLGQEGNSYEFYNQTVDDIANGRLDPEEGQKILQNVKGIEETGRQQRKAQQDVAEEQAKEKWLQRGLKTEADFEEFRQDTDLPADYRQRRIKEETSTHKANLDSAEGRSVDLKVKTAIDTGRVRDPESLYATINTLDPDCKYISHATLNSYESRLKDAVKQDESGNPKHNYFEDAIKAVKENKEFQGTRPGEKAEAALRLLDFETAVRRQLDIEGVSVYEQAAAELVLRAYGDNSKESKPWRPWETTPFTFGTAVAKRLWEGGGEDTRWYQLPEDQRPPLFRTPDPQPAGGVGGILGGSMAAAGVLARTAFDMAQRGESHWLNDFDENDTALAFAQATEDSAASQGLPLTPFTREWVGQSLLEHRPAREVTPAFAEAWPGQGKVSLTSLGKVHDYNGLIERYAVSYGIDPDLIAAMMYAESGGDRLAVSPAGASGLMQFMPATAKRFGITDRSDPAQSIRGACQYMRFLLDRFDGNPIKAVAAYNAGEGNIDKGRYPAETRKYVSKVLGVWQSAGAEGRDGGPGLTQGQPSPQSGRGGFVAPLANMLVTSKYGQRDTGIAGASADHQGLDLRAPKGTPVGSIADGVVETATYKGKNGNYVVINHGNGRKSYYLHLDGFARGLQPGATVKAGQVIGRTGNSGDFKKTLAPHLDFRIMENGKFVDPARYFANLQFKKGA